MLAFIRDRAKGFLAWFIFILIVIPFAFWGIESYFEGGGDVYVAKVNDVEIPARSYQRLLLQERNFRQQVLGATPDSPLLDEALLKRDVLERLINTEAVAQAALAAGFRISDAQLRSQIINNAQFQRDGRFDPQLYRRLLNSLGLTEPAYEAQLRRDLLVAQLMGSAPETAFVTAVEEDRGLRLQHQERRVGYLLLQAATFLSDEPVAEEEIKAYYEENLAQFSIPEQVRVEYLELAASDLVSQVSVDEETLRKLYEERQSEFMVPEERRASHILIAVDENADEGADAAAREKAESILKRLRASESFADLAKEFSDDPGSASAGGDLGFFGRGVMAKPFEEQVFVMGKDEISEPVRTRFGYHIIKLTDIRAARGRSFEEVRDILARDYREQKAEEMFYDVADRLADLTYEIPDTLEVAAEELDLEIKTSEFFSRTEGAGIAADAKVRAAAFNPEVLEEGNNSEPVTIGQNHLVVLRVKDRRPASHRPLEAVRADIEQVLRMERAREKAEEAGRKVVERLRAGEQPAEVAKELGVEWREPGYVRRDDPAVAPDVLQFAFTLSRAEGMPVIAGRRLANGDFAVVGLYEVKDTDPATLPATERRRWRQQAQRNMGLLEGNAMLESIRQRAEVEIRQENL